MNVKNLIKVRCSCCKVWFKPTNLLQKKCKECRDSSNTASDWNYINEDDYPV